MRAAACTVALIGCVALSAGSARAQDPNYPDPGTAARAAMWYDYAEILIPLTTEVVNGVTISKAENWVYETAEMRMTLESVVFDPDPMITYSFAVIDFGAPSSFSFVFSQGITSTTAPGLASHNMAGASATGVAVTATAPLAGSPVDSDGVTEIAVFNLSQDGGVTLLNAGMDLGPSASVFGTYGPFSEGPIAGPAPSGSYNFMRIDLSMGLDGSNHAFTGSGLATVTPEPGSLGLLAAGIALLALRRRVRP
jgi:hypothetical protein